MLKKNVIERPRAKRRKRRPRAKRRKKRRRLPILMETIITKEVCERKAFGVRNFESRGSVEN
jgi:hypothetical protein